MKVKEESEKVGLKLNIQKTKIMAPSPIQFSSVQSLSRVQLFVTPWITPRQVSLSITNSQRLLARKYMGKQWKQWQTIFGGCKITADGDCSLGIKRHLLLGRKVMTKLDSILKSRDIIANKGPSSESYGFSSSYIWMWELDHKEGWTLKTWCFQIVAGEDSWEFLGWLLLSCC